MKVSVDLNICQGHGRCCSNHPELFKAGDDGKSIALVPDIPDDDFDTQSASRAAAMMCPHEAIIIEE